MQRLLITDLLSIIYHSLVEIGSWSVQANPFYDRIKRVLQAETLLLLQSKQHIVLYLIEEA